jgi:ankyrin repeat protein
MNADAKITKEDMEAMIQADHSLLEQLDEYGRSPLHFAALNDKPDIVALLIRHGMKANVKGV